MNTKLPDINPSLKNDKVFSDRKMKAGIPHQMYILLFFVNGFALLIAIKFWSIASVLALLVFVLITVLPIYIIHDKDHDAHIVWRNAIFGSAGMINSETATRKVVFITLSQPKDIR